MVDDRQCKPLELLMSFAKIFLVVVSTGLRHLSAHRAMTSIAQLLDLTAPTAVRTFDPPPQSFEKCIERHLK